MIIIHVKVVNDEPITYYQWNFPVIPRKGEYIQTDEGLLEVIRVIHYPNTMSMVECEI